MNRLLSMTILAGAMLLPAHADIMPVAGNTAGTFSNPTGGSTVSGNQWIYDLTNGYVTFNGVASFNGSTPLAVYFGDITLLNYSSQPNGTYTANLNLVINFTTPTGEVVNFSDGLQLTAQSGGGASGHGDTLQVNFGGYPSPQTFVVGAETYTVTYDGFYDSKTNKNNPVTSLFVPNNPGGTDTAYLWGSISAQSSLGQGSDPVPEPGSVVLLMTVVGGIAFSMRRRQVRS